jgi:hypothetical protein
VSSLLQKNSFHSRTVRHLTKKILFMLLLFSTVDGLPQTSSADSTEEKQLLKKIRFDIDEIDENGMIGPEDGKRNMDYEFCIPLDKKKKKEVARIDRSVKFFSGPSGRSGCTGRYLCIGSGGTRKTLLRLARLEYVQMINPCYYE